MSTSHRGTSDKPRGHAPGRRIKRGALSGVLAAIVALGLASSASAASFEVNSDVDTLATDGCELGVGGCTLREALMASQINPGFDEITFDPISMTGDTIVLVSQLPNINGPMNLIGLGADQLAVSGNFSSRIIAVDTAPGDDVRVSGLTFKEGDPGNQGGALLHVDADLTVADSAITGNLAQAGGGIYSFQGTSLTIERSEITDNQAASASTGAGGGGIFARDSGPVTVRNSTIADNQAVSVAPAGPSAGQVIGGGMDVEGSTVSLTIENSTIAGNTATSLNTSAQGGGIYSEAPSVLRNTIVAANTAFAPMFLEGLDLRGTFDSAFTLVGSTSGATVNETIPGSNVIGGDPQLQPLAQNGAPTRTRALGPGSDALDAGRSYCTATDQRGAGFSRPSDLADPNSTAEGADGADIGAFEEQGGTVSVPPLCVPIPPPPAQAAAQPSNAFELGKLKRKKKKGIAFLFVTVPGPGEVGLAGKGLKRIGLASASARKSLGVAGGRVKLKVKPGKGKQAKRLRRRLRDKGKAKLKVRVTYVPAGGTANTQTRTLKLIRK